MPGDANKKLYNAGSEWQDEFSGIIDYYSTFFREYDPVIGRFNGVDPKADATVSLSIYHYSGNNPVNFNDPMGDITGNELENIINRLLSSNYGGTWSSSSNSTAYFGDEFTATFFGGLTRSGNNPLLKIIDAISELKKAGKEVYGVHFKDFNGNWSATIGFSQPTKNWQLSSTWHDDYYNENRKEYMLGTGWESRAIAGIIVGTKTISIGRYVDNNSFFDNLVSTLININNVSEKFELALEAGKYLTYSKFTIGDKSFGWWTDARGGIQPIWKKGNQWIGGRNEARAFSRNLEKISRPMAIFGTVVSGYQTIIDIRGGHTGEAILHGIDTIAGAAGLLIPGAQPFVFAYFVGRLIGELF